MKKAQIIPHAEEKIELFLGFLLLVWWENTYSYQTDFQFQFRF